MRPSHSVQAFVWIVALAMFGVRLGGVHMHLCFDGQEPPTSLHVEHEDGHDDYHHPEGSHQDQDVDLLAQAATKKADPYDLDVVGVALEVLARPLFETQSAPQRLTSIQPTGPPHYLLPPLRGPPA